MKKIFIVFSALVALTSCSVTVSKSKLISTSTSSDASAVFMTTATIADIKVSETKISFLYVPSNSVADGGYDNIINTAVREALASAGKQYDVLVAKETQVKYNMESKVESVLVTGYPGQYTNWRSSDKPVAIEKKDSSQPIIFGKK